MLTTDESQGGGGAPQGAGRGTERKGPAQDHEARGHLALGRRVCGEGGGGLDLTLVTLA